MTHGARTPLVHTRRPTAHRGRGFSLVEMLTVLAILAIVLGIVIPVVASARNAARKASTQALLASLSSAISQFQVDKRRAPGYFTQGLMGSADNAARQFTEMENLMLDLSGGIVGSSVALSPTVIQAGPSDSAQNGTVRVDVSLIGADTQATPGVTVAQYFRPDRKLLRAQDAPPPPGGGGTTGSRASGGASDHARMPVLVDPFGQPILAWSQNPAARAGSPFARESSGTGAGGTDAARFYLNSNLAFLNSQRLGKTGLNNNNDSLLGSSVTVANRIRNLEVLLGNPAFPSTTSPVTPTAARGTVILHSAGRPGVFLAKDSRGGKTAASGALQFTANQDPLLGGAFEDIVYTAGN